MVKGLIHKVNIPIYDERLYVCFCKETAIRKFNVSQMAQKDCSGFSLVTKDIFSDHHVFVMYIEKGEHGILVSTCAHECYHIADMIFDENGIEYKEGSGNEHMAYLLDWLVTRCFDCLDVDNGFENKGNKNG